MSPPSFGCLLTMSASTGSQMLLLFVDEGGGIRRQFIGRV